MVKKEIQPIFTQDAMMDGPQTEGMFSVLHFDFYFLYSGFNMFGVCRCHRFMLKFLFFFFFKLLIFGSYASNNFDSFMIIDVLAWILVFDFIISSSYRLGVSRNSEVTCDF